MSRAPTVVLCTLLSVALTLPAVAAPTADDTAQAKRLFTAASLAYDKGRYDDAARAFTEAHRLFPDPAIAFSLAQALRRQYFIDGDRQHLVRAQNLLRGYVRDVGQGRRRADATDLLQAIAVLLATTAPPRDDTSAPATPPADPSATPDPSPPASATPEPSAPTSPPPDPSPPPDEPNSNLAANPKPPAAPTELIVYSEVEGAEASVDGGAFGPVPLIAAAAPGPHQVLVRAPGHHPVRATATAIEGRIMPVEATLTPIPAQVTIAAAPGARIVLDGRELGFAPLDAPVATPPGRHLVSVTAPGRIDFSQTFVAPRDGAVQLDATTDYTIARRAAWGLLGASGGLAIAGAITTGLALRFQSQAQRIEAMRGETNLSPEQLAEYDRDRTRRDRLRGATIGLWTTAALAAITGAVLMLSDRRRRPRRRRAQRPSPARATPAPASSRVARSATTPP